MCVFAGAPDNGGLRAKNTGEPPPMSFRMKWDFTQIPVLLFIAFVVPLRIGFDQIDQRDPKYWFWFDVIADLYFYFDIFLNCRTAYLDDNHKLVADPLLVLKHYMSGWFVVDVVACLPVNYCLYIWGGLPLPWKEEATDGTIHMADNLKVLKILRLFRLTKMLRVLKLKSISDKLQDSPTYQSFLTSFKLIKLIVLLLYLSHFLGCFWYFVGICDDDSQRGMTVYGWVHIKEQEGDWRIGTILLQFRHSLVSLSSFV